MNVSYNSCETLSLVTLTIISTLHIALEGDYQLPGIKEAAFTLYLMPTITITIGVLYQQLFSKEGGYSRLKQLNFSLYWQRRSRARLDQDDPRANPLTQDAYRNMLEDAQEPLIVHEMQLAEQ